MVCHLEPSTGMCTTHTHAHTHAHTYHTQTTRAHAHKVKYCIGWMDMCKFYLVLTDLQGEGAYCQVGHVLLVIA